MIDKRNFKTLQDYFEKPLNVDDSDIKNILMAMEGDVIKIFPVGEWASDSRSTHIPISPGNYARFNKHFIAKLPALIHRVSFKYHIKKNLLVSDEANSKGIKEIFKSFFGMK